MFKKENEEKKKIDYSLELLNFDINRRVQKSPNLRNGVLFCVA